jgi:hypothetical protein
MDTSMLISIVVALLPIIAGIAVYYVQKLSHKDMFFKKCAESLYSTNPTEQITAAILLREYANDSSYDSRVKNTMVALLRTSIPSSLQKVIADVFSYSDSLEGQDMQQINMLGALIKPKARVEYELYGRKYLKYKRLSMQQADCYQAVIKECSINQVDATKAIFAFGNLSRTTFKNCLLEKANFKGANVKYVVFDEDCDLEGADFYGAVGLDEAKVKINNNGHVISIPLIELLDNKGVFCTDKLHNPRREYTPAGEGIKVFISKLGAMDSEQSTQFERITHVIDELENTTLVHIEREQYPIVSQLSDVVKQMEQCDGCVIFACEYLEVTEGYLHKKIVSNDRKELHKTSIVSPWLHIETALANYNGIPCLIIYDHNVLRDGMFDEKIIEPDRSLFAVEYSDILKENNPTLQHWINSTREYHYWRSQDLQ